MSTEAESFLARWSRRKREAERALERVADAAAPQTVSPEVKPAGEAVTSNSSVAAAPASGQVLNSTEVPLPPIESLEGLRSDYQAFFQQPVAEELRHAALKKLFSDPHFNKMDMLDVYVDDYTQFEPLPAEMRLRLASARDFLLDSERAALEQQEAAKSGPRAAEPAAQFGSAADMSAESDATDDGRQPGDEATIKPTSDEVLPEVAAPAVSENRAAASEEPLSPPAGQSAKPASGTTP